MDTDTVIVVTGLLGLALVIAAALLAFARVQAARLDALRALVTQGTDPEIALRLVDPGRASRLLRRGLLLIALGLAWSLVTWLVGGRAWIAGIAPVLVGLVLVLLHGLEQRRR